MEKCKQSAECEQTADMLKIFNFSYLTTLYCVLEVISVEILNFLNFGDGGGDEKQLVGLRQASGRRQKHDFIIQYLPLLPLIHSLL